MTKNSAKVIGVIPARYGSSRLEGKPLADLAGKTMIQRVYEQAQKSTLLTDLIVATDDDRIAAAVKKFGGKVQLTSAAHKTGTDRILEVVEKMDVDIVVNIQGDLPLLDPLMIDESVRPLIDDPTVPMSTLKMSITDPMHMQNPNVVKVVTDLNGFALYFSRAAIPFARDSRNRAVFEHIGLYAYQKKFLFIFFLIISIRVIDFSNVRIKKIEGEKPSKIVKFFILFGQQTLIIFLLETIVRESIAFVLSAIFPGWNDSVLNCFIFGGSLVILWICIVILFNKLKWVLSNKKWKNFI